MQGHDLYRDISERTQGDVYIGIVGPVRTGKSTFIARFIEKLVLPGIQNEHIKERVLDELPQSGSGRTIMTTQPAFVPHEAVDVLLPADNRVRLKLIDSVGYWIEGALGTQEGEELRMVRTPWSNTEMPFERAAEIGTKKIIDEHSTIGIVVTTDGTVTDLPRLAYVEAENRVVKELKALHKPFAIVLNTKEPDSLKAQNLKKTMEDSYGVPVLAMNVDQMNEGDVQRILESVLSQFPLLTITLQAPEWISALNADHWLIQNIAETIRNSATDYMCIGDIGGILEKIANNHYIESITEKTISHGSGEAVLQINLQEGLFNSILAEHCGTEIRSDAHLLELLSELVEAKKEYDRVSRALKEVRETGYGIVPPTLEELTLQDPEIMKQGGRFGVRLRANAPSLHMIRVDIQTEVSPVVGTEQQSEEILQYLLKGFEQNPQKLWNSNLFGKPLSELVREGLSNKLMHMPEDIQLKVQQTLQKIINDGNGGMLCILL